VRGQLPAPVALGTIKGFGCLLVAEVASLHRRGTVYSLQLAGTEGSLRVLHATVTSYSNADVGPLDILLAGPQYAPRVRIGIFIAYLLSISYALISEAGMFVFIMADS
jgi:hypothetical protein